MNGLPKDRVQDYWKARSEKQGFLTCGYAGNNTALSQNEEYAQKIEFVLPHVSQNLKTFDFGCGVGRWSAIWSDENYYGADIELNLLNQAKERHPNKTFFHLRTPTLENLPKGAKKALEGMEQFFTSCVLQHCDEEVVLAIFKRLYGIKPSGVRFALYENKQAQCDHVAGRDFNDYSRLLQEAGYKTEVEYHAHVVHGEEHGISIIQT